MATSILNQVLIALALAGLYLWTERGKAGRQDGEAAADLDGCQLTIGLLAACLVRVSLLMLLIESGYFILISDQACKWLMAYDWARSPYLITVDGIWLGGVFYYYGMLMKLFANPQQASTVGLLAMNFLFVAAVYFFAAQISASRRYGIFVAFVSVPLYGQLWLSGGPYAEPPTTLFLLFGSGLLLDYYLSPSMGLRRFSLLLLAGVCFSLATTFHYVAWIYVAVVIALATVHKLLWKTAGHAMKWRDWAIFCPVAVSYCVVWFIGCWIKFGGPFKSFNATTNAIIRPSGAWSEASWIYVENLVQQVSPMTYAFLLGSVLTVVFRRSFRSMSAIAVFVAYGALLCLTAAKMGTSATPFRQVMMIAVMFIAIGFLPLADLLKRVEHRGLPQKALICALLAFFMFSWFGSQLRKTEAHWYYTGTDSHHDSIALGIWLRQELNNPVTLARLKDNGNIFVIHDASPEAFEEMLNIIYFSGKPGKVYVATLDEAIGLAGAHDYIVSRTGIDHPGLAQTSAIGRFYIYSLKQEQ